MPGWGGFPSKVCKETLAAIGTRYCLRMSNRGRWYAHFCLFGKPPPGCFVQKGSGKPLSSMLTSLLTAYQAQKRTGLLDVETCNAQKTTVLESIMSTQTARMDTIFISSQRYSRTQLHRQTHRRTCTRTNKHTRTHAHTFDSQLLVNSVWVARLQC